MCLFDGRLGVASQPVMPREMHIDDDVQRLELERTFSGGQRVIETTLRHQEMGMPVMSVRITRVQRERALELSLAGGRAALVRGMSAAGATVTTFTLVQGWGIR